MKKGRHRRFEEARKLKQSGPSPEDLGLGRNRRPQSEEDEYAAIAKRYGVRFDDDDEEEADDDQ